MSSTRDSMAHQFPTHSEEAALCCCCTADAVPKAQEQIKLTMSVAADIEAFVKQTLGV
jgi:hypothetical protein